jgi:hypothetical protein
MLNRDSGYRAKNELREGMWRRAFDADEEFVEM